MYDPGVNTHQPLVFSNSIIPRPFSSNGSAKRVWDHRLALEFPEAAFALRGHDAG